MKRTIAIVAMLAIAYPAFAQDSVKWTSDYTEALKQAKEESKGVFIDFTAEWCGWCEKMDEEVFSRPDVAALLGDYVCVKVDIDKNPDVAAAYEVQSIPRTISLNLHREIIGDQLGFQPPVQFKGLLQGQAEDLHRETGGRPAPEFAAPPTRESMRETIRKQAEIDGPVALVAMLGTPDATLRDVAREEIAAMGDAAAPALVAGLSDAYLGTRIAALDALQQMDPEAPAFDPWASPDDRAESLKPWREWLSTRLEKELGEDAIEKHRAKALEACTNLDPVTAQVAASRSDSGAVDSWSWLPEEGTIVTATDTTGDGQPDQASVFCDISEDYRLVVDIELTNGAPEQTGYHIEYLPKPQPQIEEAAFPAGTITAG